MVAHIAMLAISIAFSVIGFLWLICCLVDLVRARQSLRWTTFPGKVLECKVEEHHGRGGPLFLPLVRYQYQCAGVMYESERIMFSGMPLQTHSRFHAKNFAAQLEPGMDISVRVSPSNPRLSVIKPGTEAQLWLAFFLSCTFLLAGLAGLIGKLQ